ncbi:MAG: alpha/beta hydrolase [Acidimicrobiia bacterium]|nr:alpha/beta hydrolase [Acidimicrobiia bacterium]
MSDHVHDRGDDGGVVDHGGVRIRYHAHGAGEPAVLLLPPWAIAHSGVWQEQVPRLCRRHRVVTYDPRGNGGSDRPLDPAAHDPLVLVGDATAVLDALGIERAVVVGNSFGTVLAYLLAALHPDRVEGAVFVNPSSLNLDGRVDDPFQQAFARFDEDLGSDEGWARLNRHSWERDYEGFVRWFVGQAFPERGAGPYRTAGIAWGLDVTPEELAATVRGRVGTPPEATAARLRSLAPSITCPTLVIHGQRDPIAPRHRAETLAALLGSRLVLVDDAGHCPQLTRPDLVAALVEELAAHGRRAAA